MLDEVKAGVSVLVIARAPAPTVTTEGRSAWGAVASASVATVWSVQRASGQPALETTLAGVSAGQPASRSFSDSAASWRPAM